MSFAEGSHLCNYICKFPNATFLDVYLEGGILDESGLPEAEKALLRKHYASPLDAFEDNLQISGNPFNEFLEFSFICQEGISLDAKRITLDGRMVLNRVVQSHAEYNLYAFETENLASGIYLLQIVTPNGITTRKVLHQ